MSRSTVCSVVLSCVLCFGGTDVRAAYAPQCVMLSSCFCCHCGEVGMTACCRASHTHPATCLFFPLGWAARSAWDLDFAVPTSQAGVRRV